MTPADEIRAVLERVKELDRAATRGPWLADFTEADGRVYLTAGPVEQMPDGRHKADWLADFNREDEDGYDTEDNAANSRLAAESRTLLPRLVKAVEILMERVDGDPYGPEVERLVAAALRGEER